MNDKSKTNPDALKPYKDCKLITLIPLHRWNETGEDKKGRTIQLGKAPRHKNWTTRDDYTFENAVTNMRNGSNIGVRMDGKRNGQRMLVIDCDPRNYDIDPLTEEPIDSAAAFFDAVGIDPDDYPVVKTGSGGLHLYCTIPSDFVHVESIDGYPGVEFKSGEGRQVVAPGSIHPDTGEPYIWQNTRVDIDLLGSGEGNYGLAPEHMLHLIERPIAVLYRSKGEYELNEDADLEALSEQLGEAIGYIGYYPHWVAFGHAIKRTLGERGYPAFCAVSNADDVHKWEELSETANGYGIPEILRLADTYSPGSRETVSAILDQMLKKTPRESGQRSAEEDFAGLIEKDAPVPFERDKGLTLDAKTIRDLEQWVYVVKGDEFIHRRNGTRFTRKEFDAAFKYLTGEATPSSLVFAHKTPVKIFVRSAFRPGVGQDLKIGEDAVFNMWRPSPIQPIAGDTSVIERHLKLLIPDDTERGFVLDWLYYAICEPGMKMMFALVIWGDQGNGKSVIGKLAKTCIGKGYTTPIDNERLKERFNGFLKDKQLAILDELKMNGNAEVANKMKLLITEGEFQEERKGIDANPYENCANFLIFSNDADAVALENKDRRYLVIQSPLSPVDEDGYYEALHEFAESEVSAAAFKHYLMERKRLGLVTMNPRGRAPDTLAKADMLEASRSDEYKDIKRAIEDGLLVGDLHTWEGLRACLSSRTYRNTTDKKLKDAIDELGICKHGRWRPYKGNDDGLATCDLYSIDNHEHYAAMSARERALAYSDKLELDLLDL